MRCKSESTGGERELRPCPRVSTRNARLRQARAGYSPATRVAEGERAARGTCPAPALTRKERPLEPATERRSIWQQGATVPGSCHIRTTNPVWRAPRVMPVPRPAKRRPAMPRMKQSSRCPTLPACPNSPWQTQIRCSPHNPPSRLCHWQTTGRPADRIRSTPTTTLWTVRSGRGRVG